jgi:hypothetical protein
MQEPDPFNEVDIKLMRTHFDNFPSRLSGRSAPTLAAPPPSSQASSTPPASKKRKQVSATKKEEDSEGEHTKEELDGEDEYVSTTLVNARARAIVALTGALFVAGPTNDKSESEGSQKRSTGSSLAPSHAVTRPMALKARSISTCARSTRTHDYTRHRLPLQPLPL